MCVGCGVSGGADFFFRPTHLCWLKRKLTPSNITHTHTHTHHEKDRVEADQVAVQATMAEGTVEVQWFFALTADGAGVGGTRASYVQEVQFF